MGSFSGRLSPGAIAHTGLMVQLFFLEDDDEYWNRTNFAFMCLSLQKCEEFRSPSGTNQRWLQVKEKKYGKYNSWTHLTICPNRWTPMPSWYIRAWKIKIFQNAAARPLSLESLQRYQRVLELPGNPWFVLWEWKNSGTCKY